MHDRSERFGTFLRNERIHVKLSLPELSDRAPVSYRVCHRHSGIPTGEVTDRDPERVALLDVHVVASTCNLGFKVMSFFHSRTRLPPHT